MVGKPTSAAHGTRLRDPCGVRDYGSSTDNRSVVRAVDCEKIFRIRRKISYLYISGGFFWEKKSFY